MNRFFNNTNEYPLKTNDSFIKSKNPCRKADSYLSGRDYYFSEFQKRAFLREEIRLRHCINKVAFNNLRTAEYAKGEYSRGGGFVELVI